MNSRDALHTLSGVRAFEQARDPATAGAGRPSGDARRSIVPACRPGAVESVSLLDVSSPINCAGWGCSVGGFSGRMKRG